MGYDILYIRCSWLYKKRCFANYHASLCGVVSNRKEVIMKKLLENKKVLFIAVIIIMLAAIIIPYRLKKMANEKEQEKQETTELGTIKSPNPVIDKKLKNNEEIIPDDFDVPTLEELDIDESDLEGGSIDEEYDMFGEMYESSLGYKSGDAEASRASDYNISIPDTISGNAAGIVIKDVAKTNGYEYLHKIADLSYEEDEYGYSVYAICFDNTDYWWLYQDHKKDRAFAEKDEYGIMKDAIR